MENKDIKEFLTYLYTRKNLSKNTILSYGSDLNLFENYLESQNLGSISLSNEHLIYEYLNTLSINKKSYNRKITAFYQFYKFRKNSNNKIFVNLDKLNHIKNDKIYPHTIKFNDVGNMISLQDKTIEGNRNKTIITLLYISGLRVSELINLKFDNINFNENYIRIIGKGNKERIIQIGELLSITLIPYINNIRKYILNGLESEYIFVNMEGDKLSRQTIYNIIENARKKANIKINVTPHTLRHCFATHMLENGADIRSVQELLGHSDINTTQIYTNITNSALKKHYEDKFQDPFGLEKEISMKKFKRAFVIVCDSMGIGHGKDAKNYNDEGSNTVKHIDDFKRLDIPELRSLGLGLIDDIRKENNVLDHAYALAMNEASLGKDTLTGHYELMGLKVTKPFKTFTDTGFPDELIHILEEKWGRKIIGNCAASGTEIIKELGEEHMKTGNVIVYTSSDSVLQIAAHEDIIPIDELYHMCEIAREVTLDDKYKLGRIIARPFVGTCAEDFKRTPRRHDYALKPFEPTLLNHLKDDGYDVLSIGKIVDIFVNEGITDYVKIVSNDDGCQKIIEAMKKDFNGLCFANLVDFDMEYGHRRNVIGYHDAIEAFDKYVNEFKKLLNEDDIMFITADHGNDPTWPGTDHTREKVPLLIYSKAFENTGILEDSDTFADLSSTLADIFEVKPTKNGKSFLNKLK